MRVVAVLTLLAACGRFGFDAAPGDDDASPSLQPSNQIDATLTTEVTRAIRVTGKIEVDADSGEITGALTRGTGEGVIDGIGYHQAGALGVFVIASLEVEAAGEVHFRDGARAAVLLVGGDATIAGLIDANAGCAGTDRTCRGPGGGTGAIGSNAATGCSPGKDGAVNLTTTRDGGGGGGGGGEDGKAGGDGGPTRGGSGGAACGSSVEPLVGGSGGGPGGKGTSSDPSIGGGGGGALQLSVLGKLIIDGTIAANGEGGAGGTGDFGNAGAGSGGGAGGAVLLEASRITFGASAIVVANGGAGGGGSHDNELGTAGEAGRQATGAAKGGIASANTSGDGGNGGSRDTAATAGSDGSTNGGGGGGSVGVIVIHALSEPAEPGVLSPAWMFSPL